MQTIKPFLWFDDNAEETVNLYTSLFEDSKILSISRYGEGGMGQPGKVMTISFQLNGLDLTALNGGPIFKFTEAISLAVSVETQEEVDQLWERLSAGGEKGQCGWLKDKYGLSWQIVPTALGELMQKGDADQTNRVTQAMLKMTKLEIAGLQKAFDQS